jgi:hypothetical protein
MVFIIISYYFYNYQIFLFVSTPTSFNFAKRLREGCGKERKYDLFDPSLCLFEAPPFDPSTTSSGQALAQDKLRLRRSMKNEWS